jgi:hypothetical protein
MDRAGLIARKNEVRRSLERIQRELEKEYAAGSKQNRRRIAQLEKQREELMAQEYALRLAIDRTASAG